MKLNVEIYGFGAKTYQVKTLTFGVYRKQRDSRTACCSISCYQLCCSLLLSTNFDMSIFPHSKDLILVKYDQGKSSNLHFVPTANTTNHLQHARSANNGYSFLLLSQNSIPTLTRQFHMRCFTSEKHYLKSKYSAEICPFQRGGDRKQTVFLLTQPLGSTP